MIFDLFHRAPKTIARLYGTIVAQARAPVFYDHYAVPDTVNGRFEMIVLHLILLLRRLETESRPVRRLGQGVFDLFCRDMDGNLREMGVGDLAVPRRMRRIGDAFYGRQSAYAAALDAAGGEPLRNALARNVFGLERAPISGDTPEWAGVDRLARYVDGAIRHLAAQDGTTLARAELSFPDPTAERLDVG
jgi:cytochrome b pre-mRNA-processing protein 3